MDLIEFPTLFAPGDRVSIEVIHRQHEMLINTPMIKNVIDSIPEIVMVINKQRQIVYVNYTMVKVMEIDGTDAILGMRPGEVLDCVHSDEMPGGCGTSEFCCVCGAAESLLESIENGRSEKECRMIKKDGTVLDLKVSSALLKVNDETFVIFTITDISSEKRRRILERIFLHDILNTAGGVYCYAELLKDAEIEETRDYSEVILDLSANLLDEIKAHKELTAAENNELTVRSQQLNSKKILESVIDLFENHDLTKNKKLMISENSKEAAFISDGVLLKRVLINMVKNAIEAVNAGEDVLLSCNKNGEYLQFSVNNPGVMPRKIQLQIFQRSFTTKGPGRGLGTYSIKLLTERYLRGKASFTSSENYGTTFSVLIPFE